MDDGHPLLLALYRRGASMILPADYPNQHDPFLLYELVVLSPVTSDPLAVLLFHGDAPLPDGTIPAHIDGHARRVAGRHQATLSVLTPPLITAHQHRGVTSSRVVAEYNTRR